MSSAEDRPGPASIVVASIKGGVGKTSTVVNLADAAASAGRSTVVWDLDPQGAATWALAVGRRAPGGGRKLVRSGDRLAESISRSAVEGIDVLPADFSLRYLDLELEDSGRPKRRVRAVVEGLKETYDVVLVDCPPGITLAVESTLHAADAVLVPVVPAALAMRTVTQLQAYVTGEKGLRRTPVLPFLSMVDRRRSTHRRLVDDLGDDGDGLLPTAIPLSVDVEAIGTHRRPVSAYAPRSRAVDAYRSLWHDVSERLA